MNHDLLDRDLLILLRNEPAVFDFIFNLTSAQVKSLRSMLIWDEKLLRKLHGDPDAMTILHRVWDLTIDRLAFLDMYLLVKSSTGFYHDTMHDAFSWGQLHSKAWLVRIIGELGLTLGNAWVLCGWIGILPYLLLEHRSELGISRVRSFDIDSRCARVADVLNGRYLRDGWIFKATTLDVNSLSYDSFGYETLKHDMSSIKLMESADTIINTSTDHLVDRTWFDSIPDGKLVIIQNNDMQDRDEHVNNVSDEMELASMYPLSRVLFAGRLDCKTYNRFMLIGYK